MHHQDYVLERVLGEGAHGLVLKALHLPTRRPVALKKIHLQVHSCIGPALESTTANNAPLHVNSRQPNNAAINPATGHNSANPNERSAYHSSSLLSYPKGGITGKQVLSARQA